MTIPATRPGAITVPPGKRRTCPRCGLTRAVNRGHRGRVCGSCRDELADLGELAVWEEEAT